MPARLPAVYFSVVLLFAAFAADDIQKVLSKLEKFRKHYPQEKVYLHLDKPYYAITDTIYFKAYVVTAEKNVPSAISNVLYVDVIDEKNEIRQTLLRPITDGTSWGTITLPDSLAGGRYRIRAYTAWMRNFDAAFFWDRPITVGSGFDDDVTASAVYKGKFTGNGKGDSVLIQYQYGRDNLLTGKEVTYSIRIDEKEIGKGKSTISEKGDFGLSLAGVPDGRSRQAAIVTRIKTDNKKTITKLINLVIPAAAYSVQFFPEGGQMLHETPALIGFKAMNADGTGAGVSGEIMDETGVVQTAFESHVAGMGSFTFTPGAGHTYYALIRHENGTAQKTELPKATAAGYALAVAGDTANIVIKVSAKAAGPMNYVTLIAQSNNRTYHTAQLHLIDGSATTVVSKKKFPTGIVQFTLFDEAIRPVAERLAFINHHDQLRIHMQLRKKAYNTKERVQMELTVKDETGNPVRGHFSIAVTDENAVPPEGVKAPDILSYLLLTSDLKGYIEDPCYYFTDADKMKEKALDNLMLTQGWSRFVWADLLADKYPETRFPAEKDLAISGAVLSRKGTPVANAKVTLLSKKGQGYMLNTLTGADGSFAFGELEFSDDKPFVVQAQSPDGSSNVLIKLNEFLPPPVTNNQNLLYPLATYSAIQPYLIQSARRYEEMKRRGWILEKGKVLQTVTVTAQRQTKVQEAVAPSANLNGPGNADQIFTYEDLHNCLDLGQCLAGRILGVTFKLVPDRDIDSRNKVPRLQAFSTRGMNKPMLVILDGMDMGSSGLDIRNIPAANIQSIEVLRSGAYLSVYGTRASGGALVVTTKRGGIDYSAGLHTNASNSAAQNTVFTAAKGYTVVRQFYVPDYSQPQGTSTPPDLRSTIFWQPNVETGDDGKTVVSFYNADAAGRYNVIIEGFTAKGQLGRAVYSYEVK